MASVSKKLVGSALAATALLAGGLAATSPSGAQEAPPGTCLDTLATVELAPSGAYGMAIDPSTGLVYVMMNDNDRVEVLDPETNEVVRTIELSFGPDFAAVHPATNTIWVTSFTAEAVFAIDLASGAELASVPVPMAQQVAINHTTGRVYVSGQSNDVTVVDAVSRTAVGTLPVGGHSLAIDVDEVNDRVFVGDIDASELEVFDGSDGSIIDTFVLPGGEPLTIQYDELAGSVWISLRGGGAVVELDPDTGAQLNSFAYADAQGLAINPSVGQGYVSPFHGSEVRVFSLDDGSEIETFATGSNTLVTAARENPVRVYVAGYDDGTVTVIGDTPPCPQFPTTTTTSSTTSTTTSSSSTRSGGEAAVRPRFAG